MKRIAALSLVAMAAGSAFADVHSQNWGYYSITGQLNAGAPTWQRPSATFAAGGGSLERYQSQAFAHSGGGLTSVVMGTNPLAWDTFLHTYSTFNAATPTTGGLASGGNDDMAGIGASRIRNITAAAGNYTSVFSEFSLSAADRDFAAWAYPSAMGDIPDNNPAGMTKTISVGPGGTIASFNSVTIRGLNHSWAGDLVITLTHGGVTVDLLDRWGVNAGSTVGEDTNPMGDFTFMIGAPALPASTSQTYFLGGTFAPFPNGNVGEGSPSTSTLNDFVGLDVAGDWVLTVSDRAGADLGGFAGWDFDVTLVPTPGTIGLVGLAGLVGLRRRRA